MSHLPLMTIAPEVGASTSILNADSLRAQSDNTASGKSSTSATSNLTSAMPSAAVVVSNASSGSFWRFQALVFLSSGLSAFLYSFVPEITGFELATVSRSLNEPWQIGVLLAWKIAELWVFWTFGLDYYDATCLFLLSQTPYYALLSLFYSISWSTILVSVAIDIASRVIPFALLRPLSPHNVFAWSFTTPSATKVSTPGPALVSETGIKLYTALFAASVYAVTAYSSLYTWLPVYLVQHFDSIRTLEHAHNANLFVLLLFFLPLGLAARDFLFTASTAAPSSSTPGAAGIEVAPEQFDPRTASLLETLAWNVGLSGWSAREDVLLGRTVMLVGMTVASSFVRIFGTIEGAEQYGALGWGGVFAAAALLTGVGFAWVGDV